MKTLQPNHGLSEIFSMLLPNEQQTRFLRACLWFGEDGRRAWLNWVENCSDTRDMLRERKFGLKGLTPLLYHNLQRNKVEVASSLLTFFRTAKVYEEKRSKVYREICQIALMALHSAKKRFLVVKGAALADTAFEKPSLRHCHDLDIVLDDSDPSDIVTLLAPLGFSLSSKKISSEWKKLRLVHKDGLPVCLHRGLFDISLYNRGKKEMWARCEERLVAGVPCQVLSAADALLHVCGQAFVSGRSTVPTWAMDSWAIIMSFPDLDWKELISSARQNHLSLPILVMLGYLKDKLQVPIPYQVFVDLRKSASQNIVGQEVALSIARRNRNGGLKGLLGKTKNWQARFPIYRWMMFPSLDYLRWTNPHTRALGLPFLYLSRPLKYLARRFQKV